MPSPSTAIPGDSRVPNESSSCQRAEIAAKLAEGGLLTVAEAAMVLAVHVETIRRALRRGSLRGVRPPRHAEWRILPGDLSQYVGVPLSILAANAHSESGRSVEGTHRGRSWINAR